MRSLAFVAVLAVSSVLVACGERADSPIKTGTTGSLATPASSAASVPPAAPDRESPPASTPTTHAQAPQPESSWTGLSTARDTPAQEPAKELSKGEETYSMPKPGQTDNHFTPSIDGALKGSQQSPGTPATQAPAPAPANTTAPEAPAPAPASTTAPEAPAPVK